ncbi:MAG TPA: type II 3-dehydroquinate dehydratase [Thermodesulfovibrionales bacterium]|nr:type II 3-dehydroquinate dehydratase [Thermodesulfovibrionales bacterium]
MKILVIHGPNLNLLGSREPGVYGTLSLGEVNKRIESEASRLGLDVTVMQSNSEGEIIDAIQKGDFDAVIINPAAYTHTSVAIRDAVSAVAKPVIEVHISNIHKREEFRRKSYIAAVSHGQITGFGAYSYILALSAAKNILSGG